METRMTVACFIRYELDPFQMEAFENFVASAVIAFASLAAYEAYRARLKADAEGMANFAFAKEKKFILREERTFLRAVPTTLCFRSER